MNKHRKTIAWNKRQEANQLANQRIHPQHISNGDERKFVDPQTNQQTFLMSYTKGLPHDLNTGIVSKPEYFHDFIRAIDSGDPRDFRDVPLGIEGNNHSAKCENHEFKWQSMKALNPELENGNIVYVHEDPDNSSSEVIGVKGNPVNVRAWESQSAGLAFELEGPDAQAVTMPPAPKLGSPELTAEIAEVYAQALLRDTPFAALTPGVMGFNQGNNLANRSLQIVLTNLKTSIVDVDNVLDLTNNLSALDWFNGTPLSLSSDELKRREKRQNPRPHTAFRGITRGDNIGPYLSQFLLVGNTGINGNDPERKVTDGWISYGAISVQQKVRTAKPNVDYMTNWHEWLDVQRGADLRGKEEYLDKDDVNARRFIHTPRDLATYVHYDALYEAYLKRLPYIIGNGDAVRPWNTFSIS